MKPTIERKIFIEARNEVKTPSGETHTIQRFITKLQSDDNVKASKGGESLTIQLKNLPPVLSHNRTAID